MYSRLSWNRTTRTFSLPRWTGLYVRNNATRTTATVAVKDALTDLEERHRQVRAEASALSRALYRLCMRSAEFIRKGNEADYAEFAAREEKQLKDMVDLASDERLSGIVSMLPPVEPESELQSRSEYYAQYTRENFFAEADCLVVIELRNQENLGTPETRAIPQPQQFARYFHYLREGDRQRKWLLEDMKFEDPYHFDLDRVNRLEEQVRQLIEAKEKLEWNLLSPEEQHKANQAQMDYENYDTDEEAFTDDEDDEDIPIRFSNPHRRTDAED